MKTTKNTTFTAYEKKCARELARAFYYTVPDFQPMLPPYSEVLAEAMRVIHDEAITHIGGLRPNSEVPLMPATGYDYIGAEYYCDASNALGIGGDLHACLQECLLSTYNRYAQDKEIGR